MSAKILNYIIAFSVVGIGIFLVRDAFFNPKTTLSNLPMVTATPAPDKSGAQKDLPVPCKHPYFAFDNGAQWIYQTTTTSQTDGKTSKISDTVTSTVVEATGSSILIESLAQKTKKVTPMKIDCKASGIFGLPFSLLSESATSFTNSLRVLPDGSKFSRGTTWSTLGEINLGLPFGADALGTALQSKIVDTGKKQTIAGNKDTATIEVALGADTPQTILTYTVAQGVGIVDFSLNMALSGTGGFEFSAKLTGFKMPKTIIPSPTSSFQ